MKYAIRLQSGKFLKRLPNGHARSEVDSLDEATLWEQPGHAKNALHAAAANNDLRPIGQVCEVVKVRTVIVEHVQRIRIVTTRPYGRRRIEVVP